MGGAEAGLIRRFQGKSSGPLKDRCFFLGLPPSDGAVEAAGERVILPPALLAAFPLCARIDQAGQGTGASLELAAISLPAPFNQRRSGIFVPGVNGQPQGLGHDRPRWNDRMHRLDCLKGGDGSALDAEEGHRRCLSKIAWSQA